MTAIASLALLEIPYPHIDPVALDLPGPLDIRWYGLGYLLGFTLGYLVLRSLARRGFLRVDPDAIGDLIFGLVVGVIVGGRIGYVLFYELADYRNHPLDALRIWQGGLSFHGGLVGVLLACVWFARKHRVTWRNVGDSIAFGAGIGICAVRVANFINGELYGRVASPDVPWAMRFPTDPVAQRLLGADRAGGMRARELLVDRAYQDGTWERIAPQVPLRHPSQLYEALGEGLLTLAVVWTLHLWNRRRGARWGDGAYGGVFLVTYGTVRTFLELFRQPDEQFRDAADPLGTVLGPLTMGQVLSLSMVLLGIVFLATARRHPPADPAAGPAPGAAAPDGPPAA
ncbi:MAG: prolipoprotein diacylglyceryl transferase [Longimicrobiaceae bacterium]